MGEQDHTISRGRNSAAGRTGEVLKPPGAKGRPAEETGDAGSVRTTFSDCFFGVSVYLVEDTLLRISSFREHHL